MNHGLIRDVPRLAPGTRVSFTACKHAFVVGHGYQIQPQEDWALPEVGTVLPPERHSGWRWGADHAWGVRDWETVVEFDRPRDNTGRRITKIPTAMLEIMAPAPAEQLALDLAVPNAIGEARADSAKSPHDQSPKLP